MTAEVPSVHIHNVDNPVSSRPGLASRIALIGAFDTTETEPKLFTSVDEAKTAFGSDATYNACSVIDDLFVGASSLLCVNTTTESSGTRDKSLTVAKLTSALAKIKGEDFDILFVADTITAEFLGVLTTFVDEMYEMKFPCGYTGALSGNKASNISVASNAGNHCYGLITQSGEFGGTDKTLLQTIARYTGIIAGMLVGNTMTMKIVPLMTGVTPEYSFETGGDGRAYVEAGITTFKCQNRGSGTYVVVNSEQPNGYDLYINRVRDYVVKEMALHQFLGERNRKATHDSIMQELARVKDQCVNTLDLLEDIQYTVKKKSSNCVDIYLDSLVFAGIITRIDVYVRVEVE